MKFKKAIQINSDKFNMPKKFIYPFFLFHMFMFGGSGFVMAYSGAPFAFMLLHGGFAIFVYVIFYLVIFGTEEVKWMFINAALGCLGIYTQMGWILDQFDKDISSYPIYRHITPFLYFVLYTFLLRQMMLDIFSVREDPIKQKVVNNLYVFGSIGAYLLTYFAFA